MQVNNHVNIVVGYKNDKSYLKETYFRQPFKVTNITEDKTGSLLKLMMVSSSPGILDNDIFAIEALVEEDANVELTTQGYQRVFTMSNEASQHMNVRIGNKGSFYFLPHPNVPHALSNFSSENNIYLSERHNLLWSEIITCGRKLSGEEFKFARFHNITNVYLNGKLIVKENVLIEPPKNNVHAIGQLEGYTHQSTLLFINDIADMSEISEACAGLLEGVEDVAFGISFLQVNGLIIRMLGQKAEKLFNCNNKLTSVIREKLSSSALHLVQSDKLSEI